MFLGTGVVNTNGFFTLGAMLTLPGAVATQLNEQAAKCAPPATGTTTFTTAQTAGLRDLTGDGIPDYFTATGTGAGTVRIGTGTGFLDAIPIDGMFMALSTQSEDCAGTTSTTTTGLFDVDGDGKPDVLTTDGSVYQVVSDGALGAPESGRLVQVDNGFGATTMISYRSAKLLATSADLNALHQVPFPEVVVGAMETTQTQTGAALLAKIQYAYGGAELVFDPVQDRFRFPGYRRIVALQIPTEQSDGAATITDHHVPTDITNPYDLPGSTLDPTGRYARYLRLGRVSDVTVLAGNVGTDPSVLLAVNAIADARRIASTHYEYDAKLLATDSSVPEACNEMVYPYDYKSSTGVSDPEHTDATRKVDACRQRGFAFTTSVQSVRGERGAPPSSGATVTTRSEIQTIDNFGRATRIKELGDIGDATRTDDDLCIDIAYATPQGTNERVLSAVFTRTVGDCTTTKIYAKDTWQYDLLPLGSVSAGLPTAHIVERHDETGAPRGEVRELDARFTPQGNLVTLSTQREDGAARTVSVNYDTFALVPTIIAATGIGVPKLRVDLTRDPLTLNVTNARDPNFTLQGTRFDGFDRPIMTTVTPTGGTEGAMSCTTYQGFDGTSADGRSVTSKVFIDPLPLATACTASGRTATVHLDELGRPRLTEQVLGDANPSVIMKVDQTYDSLGRLLFATDPYPSTQDPLTAYGTTQYWNADGTPLCSIRGKGKQERPAPPVNPSEPPMLTNEASEVYPTCFSRHFVDHVEVLSVQDAASLLNGAPQASVVKSSYLTAAGRLLARATWQGANRLEYATFTQDRLGHLASMTRYQNAAAGSNPVTSSWRTNSLGQLIELDEPDAAAQLNTYSNWGELIETKRTAAGTVKRTVQKYDAYGRVIHSEQQSAGVVDPETVHDYAYDTAVQVAPQVTAKNVLGRLAKATWPTGSVTFSYDGLGRNDAQVFTDLKGKNHVEKHTFLGDGSLDLLELFLPDTGFADEQVKYKYDSAGRGTTVTYKNGADQRELYSATTIDPFGRVRAAKYGLADYTADYDDVGRRLMKQVAVSSTLGSRKISYGTFDPVGRERSRTELKNGSGTSTSTSWSYDALGRLSKAEKTSGASTLLNQAFTYDPIGNLLTVTHTGTESGINATLSYSATDPDRISCVTFGSGSSAPCEVKYDELGSIRSQPTPTGTRDYTYLVDGSVRKVTDDGSSAAFRYDAFGQVQELDVDVGPSSTSTDARRDRHYGSLITLRQETIDGSSPQSVYTRKIPLHDGSVATRHGPGGPWIFEYGEQRGNRFFTDQNGAFVQDADYQPFGSTNPNPTGAQPGSQRYSSKQWNFGDSLAALGVSQLGARLYDPALGRFTSRDPLLIPRSAATTNPYAFASNDPVNSSDPSGLIECTKTASGGNGKNCEPEKGDSHPPPPPTPPRPPRTYPGCQSCGIELESGGSSNSTGGGGSQGTAGGSGSTSSGTNSIPVNPELARALAELAAFADKVDDYRVSHLDDSIDNMGLGYASYLVPGPAIGTAIGEALADYFGGRSQHTSVPSGSPPTPTLPRPRLAAGDAGRFGDLKGTTGDGLEAHHMPQKALGFTSQNDGGALVMTSGEHALTRTYGWRGARTALAEVGQRFRDVLARDIRDVRRLTGSKYNAGLLGLVRYYRDNFPGLFRPKE